VATDVVSLYVDRAAVEGARFAAGLPDRLAEFDAGPADLAACQQAAGPITLPRGAVWAAPARA